jgi:uncharacterized protein (TIGR00159 family)
MWVISFIEISIITVLVHYLLSFFWDTKAMDIIFGFIALLLVFFLATWFHLPVLEKIMLNVVNVAVLAVFIIFQPEIRIALSKLPFRSKKYKEISELDLFIEHLAASVYKFAGKHIGALIAIENQDSLNEYAAKAVALNATFSSELLESIFETTTPLHDGGVIIRQNTLLSAATIFPLTEDSSQLSRSMGTRHRAALGLSQVSDAVVIVVSEESGLVSIARAGIMTRGVKVDRFKAILRTIFTPQTSSSTFMNWVSTNK